MSSALSDVLIDTSKKNLVALIRRSSACGGFEHWRIEFGITIVPGNVACFI